MISLGIDSSNYRSSAAALYEDFKFLSQRKLLEVPLGDRGLRQSDAVFAHTRQLPLIVNSVLKSVDVSKIDSIGVSDKPRPISDSYMPCFLSGLALAEVLSSALGVPLFKFSHQEGHIAAALLSSGRMDLFKKRFIAFHVSGGTTEALLVTPSENGFNLKIVAETLDINIGQVIDRVGVMMGLEFPCGQELEKLAIGGKVICPVKTCIKGSNCALSGAENKCKSLLEQGNSKQDVSAYILDFVAKTLCDMTIQLKKTYGDLPFVYSGGVMANKYIKDKIKSVVDADFATAELSGDNAVGIALLAKLKMEE